VPDLADVAQTLAALSRPGDLVLTLGAGNITDVAPQLLELLAAGAGR
jgi:UDP-N-acetylmuramate--alanine ligase